jgi:hypothetical protein
MKTVTGIFRSKEGAEEAVERLKALGVKEENINLLMPGTNARTVETNVETSDTEGSGVGTALGAVIGGSAGASIGTLVGAILLPGVGPVLAVGIAAAALLGFSGAVVGASAGTALDNAAETGIPHDEIYVYEDALRKGRTVLIAFAENEQQAENARDSMERLGVESIDAARDDWWTGLREVEQEKYDGDFIADEKNYRMGFQGALDFYARGKSYTEALGHLQNYYPTVYEAESFRYGYERGQKYYDTMRRNHGIEHTA